MTKNEQKLRLLSVRTTLVLSRTACALAAEIMSNMGYLMHGTNEYEFDDRVLAHLKVVVGQKLKKQECFFLSWTRAPEEGSGRVSVWLSPYSNLAFRFAGSRPPQLNLVWVKVLTALSHTPRGLVVVSEDEAETYARKNPDLI